MSPLRLLADRALRPPAVVAALLALFALGAAALAWFLRDPTPSRIDAPAPLMVERDPVVPALPPAQLAAPVLYDLAGVIHDLEEAVPRSFGDLDVREAHPEHDRVEVAYHAERTPLRTELRGNVAHLSATFSYAARAWYDPPLLPAMSVGCGTEEDAERPRIGVNLSSPLELDREWVLRSRIRVDTLFAVSEEDRDRCRITPLNIDVTGTVVRAVRGELEQRTDEIDRLVAGVDVRSHLQGIWHTLETPVRLTDDVWLMLNPREVTRGGTHGEGGVVRLEVAVSAYPVIHLGPSPHTVMTELPPLGAGEVAPSAILLVEGRLHYAESGALLMRELGEREIQLSGGIVRIERLSLSGIGDGRVALEVDFEGTARGTLFLVGRPQLDLVTGELHVPDLDFDVETRNLLVGGLVWLRHEQLVRVLRERARLPVARVMEHAREQLLRGMNRNLSSEVTVEGEVFSTRLLEVYALREALVVHAEADARATLRVSQEAGPEPQ